MRFTCRQNPCTWDHPRSGSVCGTCHSVPDSGSPMHKGFKSIFGRVYVRDNRGFVLPQRILGAFEAMRFRIEVGATLFTMLNTSHAISFILFTWRYSVPAVFKRSLYVDDSSLLIKRSALSCIFSSLLVLAWLQKC